MKFIWKILPYGIIRWYAMKHCKNTVLAQSYFFGHNDNSKIKGGNCKQFNEIYLGNGLYYLVNPTEVDNAKMRCLQNEIERLKYKIKCQDCFVFDDYTILTETNDNPKQS